MILPHLLPRRTNSTPRRRHAGASLLELVIVVALIAVLAALVAPSYKYFKRKAEDAACMANMRSLHAALSTYMHDHSFVWPQNPFMIENGGKADPDESEEAKWWYETLKDYGPTRETWLCPSERRGFEIDNDKDHYDATYVPTNFDDTPNRAYEWKTQPWVVERGGFHDLNKANVIFPDGHLEKHEGAGMIPK